MTLENAIHKFSNLIDQSTKASEKKVYGKFLQLLDSLKNKNLSKIELISVENELDKLKFNSTSNLKQYKNELVKLERFLKDTLGLTPSMYFRKLYGGLGLSFGILFGVIFLSSFERSIGISLGMVLGMVIGSLIGMSFDSKAKQEGKII